MRSPRVFIASLATETNTFSPLPSGALAFAQGGVTRSASRAHDSYAGGALVPWRQEAEARGCEVVESLSAYAEPLGRTLRHVYEGFRDTILADLAAAGPVDLVLLFLHGAMVAEGYDDCEGDLVGRARSLAPDSVIGVELDPHCHLTAALVEAADMVAIFKEYPHVDVAEVAGRLFDACWAIVEGRSRPTAALVDCRMVGFYPTFAEPMRGIVRRLRELEADGTAASASIAHGFPWGDVRDVGTRVLVYSEDPQSASREAGSLAERLYDNRQILLPAFPGLGGSLDRAAGLNGRVVIGDHADNPGGGAPGDSTYFLAEILARGLTDVALGPLYDPEAARLCADAEAGGRFRLRLGGKLGPSSGAPLDLEVEVLAVREDHEQDCLGERQAMGLCAAVRCAGVDIVISSRRSQAYGLDLFTGLGVELEGKRLIIVKSSRHFEAAYGGIADHLWTADAPGALTMDFAAFPYSKRDGDYFPRVRDPWASVGRPQPRLFAPRRSR